MWGSSAGQRCGSCWWRTTKSDTSTSSTGATKRPGHLPDRPQRGQTTAPSVAEGRRSAVSDPLPHGHRTGDLGVRHEVILRKLLRLEADRTDHVPPPGALVTIEQLGQRGASGTGNPG